MMLEEKDRLLALFDDPSRWCRDMEACDGQGRAVHYDDPQAVAWDLTGGLCRLFGWVRAMELFPQLDRSLSPKAVATSAYPPANPGIASMVALQELNDQPELSYDSLIQSLHALPVWRAGGLTGAGESSQ